MPTDIDPSLARSDGTRSGPMRVGTILTSHGPTLGLDTPAGVLDVAAAAEARNLLVPTTMEQLIASPDHLVSICEMVDDRDSGFLMPLASTRFASPVRNPGKIICVGLNYRSHVAETGATAPDVPTLFNKFATSLNHHRGTIDITGENATRFDYEAELVAVIGRHARDVSTDDALAHVFGYSCGNDFTARDLQFASSQWMLGKAGDGWAPFGPWITPAADIDPAALTIECLVNGDVMQRASTGDMIFGVAELVSYISRHLTLEPGDLIFTGTPAGVIMGKPPAEQRWLAAGDVVTTRITGLGELEFTLT